MMTAAGSANSATRLRAASRSTKLLYDSSLPQILRGGRQSLATAARRNIQRCSLMRIFAVTQRLQPRERNRHSRRKLGALAQIHTGRRGTRSAEPLELSGDQPVVA